ncbi:MAG TPA: guanine deaminase [Bryobacteraceae bacterium]|nr:guanine deaminase [Bryobacteraceae bacterium]
MSQTELLRGGIFHTPKNPLAEAQALTAFADGGLAIQNGRILKCADYAEVRAAYPDLPVRDLRGRFILPGFVDTHIHFPQVRILGGLGFTLVEWLEQVALPEEARLADENYAATIAREFVAALAAHGTTTALVFGSHFAPATAALFEAAAERGLRVASGLVLSDRGLRTELRHTPQAAYDESRALLRRFHGRCRLSYAVMPRFALSTSETMLEVCAALLADHPEATFTTHINENRDEIAEVARLFPWASDYFAVYERYSLAGRRSVFAHNVHATDEQIRRLSGLEASIAHCPASNAALGSGIFPMARHLAAGVRCALGTDVGGGTGFGMMKEALAAYLVQRLAPEPIVLAPATMLYLATRAGAEALGMEHETGDFSPGKSADFVVLAPPADGVLAARLKRAGTPGQVLAALFTLAGAESVREVRVEGQVVFGGDAGGLRE